MLGSNVINMRAYLICTYLRFGFLVPGHTFLAVGGKAVKEFRYARIRRSLINGQVQHFCSLRLHTCPMAVHSRTSMPVSYMVGSED